MIHLVDGMPSKETTVCGKKVLDTMDISDNIPEMLDNPDDCCAQCYKTALKMADDMAEEFLKEIGAEI